ncbi:MAG: DUF2905 domain-containing protein [Ginsengibacter sp.]
MDQQTGKYLLIAGLIIVVAGVLIYFFHDYFKWVGRLPGDIIIKKENFTFYFPLATMIVISLFITAVVQIVKRFL